MIRRKFVQIENKNAILELLEEGKQFDRMYLANNAYKDEKTKLIMHIANQRKIPVERVARKSINRRSRTSSSESIIGLMEVDNQYDMEGLFEHLDETGQEPFFLILDDVKYSQNIGAIFRTAFATGVNGVITPISKGNLLTDEIIRISMGACLRIPIVEMNLFQAMSEIKKKAVKIYSLDMDGTPVFETNLSGPAAFILGAEDTGVSSKMNEKADQLISIPMKEGIGSLNVSVSAGVIMYMKYITNLNS